MSDYRVTDRGGWLKGRSEALAEVVGFAVWSLKRMASRERRLASIAFIVAVALIPVAVYWLGAWGWLWAGAVAVGATVFLLLLLVSYLRVAFDRTRRAERDQVVALVGRSAEASALRQQDLSASIQTAAAAQSEALAAQAEAIVQATALSFERLENLRRGLEASAEAANRTFEARLTALDQQVSRQAGASQAEVTSVRRALSELSGVVAEQRTRAEAELVEMGQRLEVMARDAAQQIEGLRAADGAVAAELIRTGRQADEFRERERAEREQAMETLRLSLEASLATQQDEAERQGAYLRQLIDRRVGAGADVVMAEIDALRKTIPPSLAAELDALRQSLPTTIKAEVDALSKTLPDAIKAEVDALSERLPDAIKAEVSVARQAVTETVKAEIGVARQQVAETVKGEIEALRQEVPQVVQGQFEERERTVLVPIQKAVAELNDRYAEADTLGSEAREELARQQKALTESYSQIQNDVQGLTALVSQTAEAEREARDEAIRAAIAAEPDKTREWVTSSLADLRALLDKKMGPEFEARLDAWRARLDNEIASAVQEGRSEDQAAAQEREGRLRAELEALQKDIVQQRAEAVSKAEVSALAEKTIADASVALEKRLVAQVEEAKAGQDSIRAVVVAESRKLVDAAVKTADERILAATTATKAEVAKLGAAVSDLGKAGGITPAGLAELKATVAAIEERANASAHTLRKLTDANAVNARPFDRLLDAEKIKRFETHWLRTLGLNMNRTSLAYLAHKICLLEDRGVGRIAAPIETIIMRQLALRSLPNRGRLEVMEIGSLFGLSAAALYNFRGARASGMNLTLVDPLEGYYEAGAGDIITGVEICEEVLRENLATLGVPDTDYRLIKSLSADPKAINQASDRLYDLILIDGDHSTAGVAADFENYGPLVKPGGIIIFDDYGSQQWPGIQPYVDETVRSNPNWIWIGADYRTAILAKKADGEIARISRTTPARGQTKKSS